MSTQPTIGRNRRAEVIAIIKGFDPNEVRGEHGKWAKVGVGDRRSFATGTDDRGGKAIAGFKATVVRRAPSGQLVVNAGSAKSPRYVHTHERHASEITKKPAARGDSKRTFAERLTPTERKAILDYMSESYRSINSTLRKGDSPSAVTQARIDAIDSAIEKGRVEADTTLYRALSLPDGPEGLVGKTIVDHGFVSTSETARLPQLMASKQRNGIYARIAVPAGTSAGFLRKVHARQATSKFGGIQESEVLLPRGSKFKVTAATKGADGVWNVSMELVP